MFRYALCFLIVFIVAGCATGSSIVTGTPRDPIDPSFVKIYRTAPDAPYEHIGIVKSESEEVFSQQEAVDRALVELKNQAAKIGANGIILSNMGEKQETFANFTPNASGGGFFHSGTSDYQVLQGEAIYIRD